MGKIEGDISVSSVAWHGVPSHRFQSPFTVFLGNNMGTASLERDSLGPEDVYHRVDNDETFPVDVASRPPVPVPRSEASSPGAHQLPNNEPYISKGKYGWE